MLSSRPLSLTEVVRRSRNLYVLFNHVYQKIDNFLIYVTCHGAKLMYRDLDIVLVKEEDG